MMLPIDLNLLDHAPAKYTPSEPGVAFVKPAAARKLFVRIACLFEAVEVTRKVQLRDS